MLDSTRWQQIEELVQGALLVPAEDRAAWLSARCNGEDSLREEVSSLLAFADESEDFLRQPAAARAAGVLLENEKSPTRPGQSIGPYKVVSEIGRGGMGVVFLAIRDDDQFKKQVAIKLLRRGMDTEDILRRFRNERQILASLEHPNIARLLDGGMTADGLPYFVLEYVEGKPLDGYCDQNKLSTHERLQLFRKVCAAVQYAHQNLIVHRDLKPSNILVTPDGEPKLLDFGIAKLLGSELSDYSLAHTATQARLLTPDYASPEQIRGKNITTASDVYSLGVLLYRLLTGHAPYRFVDLSAQEIERLVCDTDPERPSVAIRRVEEIATRDGASKITPETVGQAHDEQPGALRRRLQGDLDNIVLKAMRKEPDRRYSSPAQLSEDIDRYLVGLPVNARKDTFLYRTSKFIARNKVGVAAAVIVILTILGGLTVSVWQARVARQETAKAQAVNEFLQTMLLDANPSSTLRKRKNDASIRDVLDEASRRLASGYLSDQPEVKAKLQRMIGAGYLSGGHPDLAEGDLTAALESQTRIYGNDHLETLKTLILLATVWAGKGDYAKADNFYQKKISIIRAEHTKGNISADYLMTALYSFALTRRVQGDSKEAEVLLREELALGSKGSPITDDDIGTVQATLDLALADQGRFDEAEQNLSQRIASIRQQSSEEASGPSLTANLSILGGVLMEKGELTKAEAALRESESISRRIYDRNFMSLGNILRLEAQVLYAGGKYAEADAKINETLSIYRKSSGPGYINYPTALIIQGLIYSKNKRQAEGEKLLREAVQIRSERMPEAHFLRAVANGVLGEFLTTEKRFEEAEPLLLNSYANLKISQAANSARTKTALQRLVVLYENWGRPDQGSQYRRIVASL